MKKNDMGLEKSVLENLEKAGVILPELYSNHQALGAAVSGGADSVSLLVSLCHILRSYSVSLKVITVNHNIREEKETKGDAEFVLELCRNLKSQGFDVEGFEYDIERGKVQKVSEERGKGVEEAARFLRYEAFEQFKAKFNLPFIAIAHNLNDSYENMLMRFFFGAGPGGLRGIGLRRDFYVRPLFNVSRKDIEAYLKAEGFSFRTDKTNFENDYYRNKVRNLLVPFLDKLFDHWKEAVSSSRKRFELDEDYFEIITDGILPDRIEEVRGEAFEEAEQNSSEKSFSRGECSAFEEAEQISKGKSFSCIENARGFYFRRKNVDKLHAAVLSRVLMKYVSVLYKDERFPFEKVYDVCEKMKKKKQYSVFSSGIEIGFDSEEVYVKKSSEIATESGFFGIIEESGEYEFPFGKITVNVTGNRSSVKLGKKVFDFPVPFCVRSRENGDRIRTKAGTYKNLNDVFSSWKIPEEKRNSVPVFQEVSTEKMEILLLAGSVLGKDDWKVLEEL